MKSADIEIGKYGYVPFPTQALFENQRRAACVDVLATRVEQTKRVFDWSRSYDKVTKTGVRIVKNDGTEVVVDARTIVAPWADCEALQTKEATARDEVRRIATAHRAAILALVPIDALPPWFEWHTEGRISLADIEALLVAAVSSRVNGDTK